MRRLDILPLAGLVICSTLWAVLSSAAIYSLQNTPGTKEMARISDAWYDTDTKQTPKSELACQRPWCPDGEELACNNPGCADDFMPPAPEVNLACDDPECANEDTVEGPETEIASQTLEPIPDSLFIAI